MFGLYEYFGFGRMKKNVNIFVLSIFVLIGFSIFKDGNRNIIFHLLFLFASSSLSLIIQIQEQRKWFIFIFPGRNDTYPCLPRWVQDDCDTVLWAQPRDQSCFCARLSAVLGLGNVFLSL
jgi:hypothetical protein